MIKDDILNLCEGRFEKLAKNLTNQSFEKTLRRVGLDWNGGDTIYNTKKNNATLVSFGLNKNSSFYNLVKKYITIPSRLEVFLEYNLRTKKFRFATLDYEHEEGERFPKQSTRELPKEFNEEPLVKKVIPIIIKYKNLWRDACSQSVNSKDAEAATDYATAHNLQREENYFNY